MDAYHLSNARSRRNNSCCSALQFAKKVAAARLSTTSSLATLQLHAPAVGSIGLNQALAGQHCHGRMLQWHALVQRWPSVEAQKHVAAWKGQQQLNALLAYKPGIAAAVCAATRYCLQDRHPCDYNCPTAAESAHRGLQAYLAGYSIFI
jgi:hypothetical protein